MAIDESGEQIGRILEFVNSKGTERFRGLIGRAMGNLGGEMERTVFLWECVAEWTVIYKELNFIVANLEPR